MPDLCYRLKGRLIKVSDADGAGHEMFLRAFEGKIGNNIFKCDNDCCCSNSKGVFELPARSDFSDDADAIIEAFTECGLALRPSYTLYPPKLGLRSSCIAYRIVGSDKIRKLNFDFTNPSPYYKRTLGF